MIHCNSRPKLIIDSRDHYKSTLISQIVFSVSIKEPQFHIHNYNYNPNNINQGMEKRTRDFTIWHPIFKTKYELSGNLP